MAWLFHSLCECLRVSECDLLFICMCMCVGGWKGYGREMGPSVDGQNRLLFHEEMPFALVGYKSLIHSV